MLTCSHAKGQQNWNNSPPVVKGMQPHRPTHLKWSCQREASVQHHNTYLPYSTALRKRPTNADRTGSPDSVGPSDLALLAPSTSLSFFAERFCRVLCVICVFQCFLCFSVFCRVLCVLLCYLCFLCFSVFYCFAMLCPALTMQQACCSWPIRESSSRFSQHFLVRHAVISPFRRASFSAGRLNVPDTESICIPKKDRTGAGPSSLWVAIGMPNRLHRPKLVSRCCLHRSDWACRKSVCEQFGHCKWEHWTCDCIEGRLLRGLCCHAVLAVACVSWEPRYCSLPLLSCSDGELWLGVWRPTLIIHF